jgi:hypothetical protein
MSQMRFCIGGGGGRFDNQNLEEEVSRERLSSFGVAQLAR